MAKKFITLVQFHTHNGQKHPPGKTFEVGPDEVVMTGVAEWMVRHGVAVWGDDRSHAPRGNADPTAPAGGENISAPTPEPFDCAQDRRGSDQTTIDFDTTGEPL